MLLTMVGCANKFENIELCDSVLKKPSSVVIIQNNTPVPQFHKTGGQGLLDVAINNMMTNSAAERVAEIDTQAVINERYIKPFAAAFRNKSFSVSQHLEPLDFTKLSAYQGDCDTCAALDFTAINRGTGNAEMALVLETHAVGVIRDYYGFIPTSSPQGYAKVTVYLVCLKDNSVLGRYHVEAKANVDGNWDTPPDYIELAEASRVALASALDRSYMHFFVK